MDKQRVLLGTYPFGQSGKRVLEILQETGHEIVPNPFGRRLKESDLHKMIADYDVVIAGTEPYTREVLRKAAGRLKAICRVGIGLDNVDLAACKEYNIAVTYTPDAPSQAVAELAVADMINLTRYILKSDRSVREGAWNRSVGLLIRELTIGIVGVGRIGKIVTHLLQPFNPKIIACDLKPDLEFGKKYGLTWCNKDEIFKTADLISLHIPSNRRNHHYVDRSTIAIMKTDSFLINTSRGPVVDEKAIVDALKQGHLAGAAFDVFEKEPYEGPLTKLDNVILTAHMGASARACRYLMELGAAEDCVNYLLGRPYANPVPEEEYEG